MKKILIAILVVIVAAVGAYYAFPEKMAKYIVDYGRSKAGLTKKEIKIDDHNIVYLEGGKGVTILLLHGYAANKDNWTRFAAKLTKDYHVVIPDIPGFGESTRLLSAKYDETSQVERLHKFAAAIKINRFHIAGNSMGGLFSGVYAVSYPAEVISLGLFDAAGVKPLQLSEFSKLRSKGENPLVLKDEKDLPRLMGWAFAKPPFLPYPFKKMFIKEGLANKSFNEKVANDFKDDLHSLEKDLPKIKAPALILWGDQDKIIDISSVPVFEKGLRNHQTVIIKDCGHIPMIEKIQETADAYLSFIRSIKN
jgi:abhydrolase domain-containing protein 6